MKLKNKIYLIQGIIFSFIVFLFILQINTLNKKNSKNLESKIDYIIKTNKYDLEYLIENIYKKHHSNKEFLSSIHKYAQEQFEKDKNVSLEVLKKQVKEVFIMENMDIDIFLINSKYVITQATYKKDIGFDLNFTDDSINYLDKTKLDSKIYVASNISIDLWDSNLNAYSYSKINDELYFEMGFKFDNSIYKPIQDKIKNIYNHTNNKVEIYRVFDNSEGMQIYHTIFDDKPKINSKLNKSDYEKSLKKFDKNIQTSNNYINAVRLNKIQKEQIDNKLTLYVPILSKNDNKFLEYNNILMKIQLDISEHIETINETKKFFYMFGFLLLVLFLGLFYLIHFNFYKPIITILKNIQAENKIVDKKLLNKQDEFGLLTKNYNKLFDSMNNHIEENTKLLNQNKRFIADTIHQIRTPLTNIVMNAEMLKQLDTNEENHELIEQIDASTNMLSNSYEDFSYVSSYNIIDYNPQKLSLSKQLQNRIKFFNTISKVNYKIISSNIEDDIYFFINKIELERLIDNNISNAIKYAKINKNIQINLYKKEHVIYLEFKSYGNEIKNKNRIFDKNYRENKSSRGLGLGLNIVKNICEKYDIKYLIKSDKDVNSFIYTFYQKQRY